MDTANAQKAHSDPYLKRWSSLAEFAVLGPDFIDAVEVTWLGILESRERSTQRVYSADIKRFFGHLVKIKNARIYPHFFSLLESDFRTIPPALWEVIQGDFRYSIQSSTTSKNRRKSGIIHKVRILMRALARDGVIPHVSWLASFPDLSKPSTRGLGDLADPHTLFTRLRSSGVEVSKDEASAIPILYEALATEALAGDVTANVPDIVLMVINHRLECIRTACEKIVLQGAEHLARGAELIRNSDRSGAELEAELLTGSTVGQLFPCDEVGRARLLTYVKWKWAYMPGGPRSTPAGLFRLQITALGHGGPAQIDTVLNPSRRVLAATTALLLIDTLANPTPIHELGRAECLATDNSYPGYRWINWFKRRAGGREEQKLLPELDPRYRMSSVAALALIRDATEELSKRAPADQSGYVFITARGQHALKIGLEQTEKNPIRLLGYGTFLEHFAAIVNGDAGLRDTHVTPVMLRSYLLLKIAIETRSIFKVQEAGQHASIRTSWGYVYRLPYQLQHDLVIREFLETLQVLLTRDKQEFFEKLGINAADHALRLGTLMRTGLGIDCLDPLAGLQPGSIRGEMCDQVQNCPFCKNAKRQIVADVNTITDIILWRNHLLSERERMQRDQPERWEVVWLPWLIFCDAVMEKVRARLQFRLVLRAAEDLAATTNRPYPRLW